MEIINNLPEDLVSHIRQFVMGYKYLEKIMDIELGESPTGANQFGRKLYRGSRGGVYYKRKGRKVYV